MRQPDDPYAYIIRMEAWLEPMHEEHNAMRRRVGKTFDTVFDLDATNQALAKAMRACRGDYRRPDCDIQQ